MSKRQYYLGCVVAVIQDYLQQPAKSIDGFFFPCVLLHTLSSNLCPSGHHKCSLSQQPRRQYMPKWVWDALISLSHLFLSFLPFSCTHIKAISIDQFREWFSQKPNSGKNGRKIFSRTTFSASECVNCVTTWVPEGQKWKQDCLNCPWPTLCREKNPKYILSREQQRRENPGADRGARKPSAKGTWDNFSTSQR